MFKQRFLQELRTTLKSGGLTCAMSERELIEFHNFLEKSFPFGEEHRAKQGLACVGKQPVSCGGDAIWVLNPDVHIDSAGVRIPVCDSKYAWQPIGGPTIELAAGKNTSLSLPLHSDITLPLALQGRQGIAMCLDDLSGKLRTQCMIPL